MEDVTETSLLERTAALAVDYVLEVLGKPNVKGIQVDLAVDNLEQSVVLVDGQVFDDCLALGSKLLSGSIRRKTGKEMGVDLF